MSRILGAIKPCSLQCKIACRLNHSESVVAVIQILFPFFALEFKRLRREHICNVSHIQTLRVGREVRTRYPSLYFNVFIIYSYQKFCNENPTV